MTGRAPRLLVILSASMLAGCNLVGGTAADFDKDRSQEILKPGYWREVACISAGNDPAPCPPGGGAMIVTPDSVRLYPALPVYGLPGDWGVRYAISEGPPLLVALQIPDGVKGRAPVRDLQVFYVAIEPTRRDSAGRIVELNGWPVECGPPLARGDPRYGITAEPRDFTDRPYPGVEMVEENCTAKDRATVLNAARARRAGGATTLRWISDEP